MSAVRGPPPDYEYNTALALSGPQMAVGRPAPPTQGGPGPGPKPPIGIDFTRPSTPEEISWLKSMGREDLIVTNEVVENIDWEAERQARQERLIANSGPCARVVFEDEDARRVARAKAGLPDRDLGTVLLAGGAIVTAAFLLTM